MKNIKYLSTWVRRFLTEYVINNRNLSPNTLASYRDTMRLIIPYASKLRNKSIDKLMIEDLNADLIKNFLSNIETERKCSISTRNQRLAAINSFAKFVSQNCIDYIEWVRMIKLIPIKKGPKKTITYLDRSEMDALLDEPEKQTKQGQRDYALILLLYNTGARANEVAQMTISNLSLAQRKNEISTVLIKGKGNKQRRCPLWQETVDQLTILSNARDPSENLFINRQKQSMTRFGIYNVIEKYTERASLKVPSISKKKRQSAHYKAYYSNASIAIWCRY